MNKNILIVLAGGFLIAVLVALMVQMSLGGGKKKPVVPVPATSMVAVAATPIAVGQALSAENMKWQSWPKDNIFEGAIIRTDPEQAVEDAISGRVTGAVSPGQPILKTMLVSEDANMMAATLRAGMRAVSIELRPAAIVSGFVSPGDYVDVILTYRARVTYKGDNPNIGHMKDANLDKLATETIIENVRVLGVDQSMKARTASSEDSKKSSKIGKTVTLEVTPRGAEVIGLARKMGDVTLALRRLGDDKVSTEYTPAVTDARVSNIWDEIYATMENIENHGGADSAGQTPNSMRIYNGAVVREIQMNP
jgi:pilus assembly protein CpaB